MLVLRGPGAVLLLPPRRRALHGEARFATRREIARAGLFGDRGSFWAARAALPMLARPTGRVLAAPPRAGKGTGVVIPNLLTGRTR